MLQRLAIANGYGWTASCPRATHPFVAPKVAEEVYQWIGLFAAGRTAILLVDHNVRRVVKMSVS
jgi:hypothetical protein